jgi:hypothetical protein
MLEIGTVLVLSVVMGKIADADGRSALAWGGATFLLCLASVVIDLPYLRVLLAAFLVFVAMIIAKACGK